MKVSIIITSYNEKEYLTQAITSCLSQDYQGEYEIIISDDGSTDGSIEIINEFSNNNPEKIKCVFDKRDDGEEFLEYRESNCRERGINISTGDYLMILDGDDIIRSDKIRVQAEFLDKNKNYVACYTDFEWFWGDGKRMFTTFYYSELNSVLLWSKEYIHLSAFLFRRNVLANLFPHFINDCMAVRSILKTGKVYHLPGYTFLYRQRDESLWHTYDQLEKRIVEVNTLQTIMDSKWFYCSSLSKYQFALDWVFAHKNELSYEKYQQYFSYLANYQNHILFDLKSYENLNGSRKLELHLLRLQSRVFCLLFTAAKKIVEMVNHKPVSTTNETMTITSNTF